MQQLPEVAALYIVTDLEYTPKESVDSHARKMPVGRVAAQDGALLHWRQLECIGGCGSQAVEPHFLVEVEAWLVLVHHVLKVS